MKKRDIEIAAMLTTYCIVSGIKSMMDTAVTSILTEAVKKKIKL